VQALAVVERALKEPVFGCRMCGQCVLHSTGMTCPMTCPKGIRNGPCGGVREDGHCEVDPEMECVWLKAERRARTLPLLPSSWRDHFGDLRPPLDNRLRGTSAWANAATRRDQAVPEGWEA
jgi:Methylene-tetrahydrofolate reductase C terminal